MDHHDSYLSAGYYPYSTGYSSSYYYPYSTGYPSSYYTDDPCDPDSPAYDPDYCFFLRYGYYPGEAVYPSPYDSGAYDSGATDYSESPLENTPAQTPEPAVTGIVPAVYRPAPAGEMTPGVPGAAGAQFAGPGAPVEASPATPSAVATAPALESPAPAPSAAAPQPQRDRPPVLRLPLVSTPEAPEALPR